MKVRFLKWHKAFKRKAGDVIDVDHGTAHTLVELRYAELLPEAPAPVADAPQYPNKIVKRQAVKTK